MNGGKPDPGRRPRGRVCKAWLTTFVVAGGLAGCQTAPDISRQRAYQPLQVQGQPARSLVMPPFAAPAPTTRQAGSPANPWYASRLDRGPAAFAGFRGVRIIESQTRTFDQQQVFSGRVRDNFREQRVTRTRVITAQ
ncbi:MAG: hypothetical protein AAGI68_05050 [Planctomycetota bacterium]